MLGIAFREAGPRGRMVTAGEFPWWLRAEPSAPFAGDRASSQLAPWLPTQNPSLTTAMFTHPESSGQLGAVWRFSRKLRDLAGKMSGRLGAVRARCLRWLPEASGLQSVGDSEGCSACRWPTRCRVALEGPLSAGCENAFLRAPPTSDPPTLKMQK